MEIEMGPLLDAILFEAEFSVLYRSALPLHDMWREEHGKNLMRDGAKLEAKRRLTLWAY